MTTLPPEDKRPTAEPPEPETSPVRRRRARRTWWTLPTEARHEMAAAVAQRAVPTVDFFLQTVLAALIWVWALIYDAPAGLLLGALAAPLLRPVVGLSLGIVTGAGGYLARMAGALTVGATLTFGIGLLGGVASPVFAPLSLTHTLPVVHLSLINGLLLSVGVAWSTWALARTPHRAAVPGVALAYTLTLPLTAAGFGLAGGYRDLWPAGLVTFGVHFAWAVVLGAAVLLLLGFRPGNLWGYVWGGVALAIAGAAAVWGWPLAAAAPTPATLPTLTPPPPTVAFAPVPQITPTAPPTVAPTATFTPTATITPSPTLTPSPTPTRTPTPTSTPLVAFIQVAESNGAIIRSGPGFDYRKIGGALNGTQVFVLEVGHEADGVLWAKVYVPAEDLTGWVVQKLLLMATPAPRW